MADGDTPISVNDRAAFLMGWRQTDVMPIDLPCELGYWCPVCKVPAFDGKDFDQRLHWSEYNGFLWCEVCNKDIPSALCVPLDLPPDPNRSWVKTGIDAAIGVYLASLRDAVTWSSK